MNGQNKQKFLTPRVILFESDKTRFRTDSHNENPEEKVKRQETTYTQTTTQKKPKKKKTQQPKKQIA